MLFYSGRFFCVYVYIIYKTRDGNIKILVCTQCTQTHRQCATIDVIIIMANTEHHI